MFEVGIGGGKNKSKSKTSSNNTLDPWAQQKWEQTAGDIRGVLSANPAKPYTGDLTAGPNAYQTQAGDAVKGLLGFKPATVSAKSLSDIDLAKYTDPNTDAVINSAFADIEQGRQQQRVNDAQGATAAGAWGGSRHGVADALTNEAADRTRASTAANLRSQAYNNAVAAAQRDIDRDFTAQTTNASLGLSGAQFGLQGAGLLGQIGSDIRAGDQAGLDRLYAEFGRLQDDPFKRASILQGLLSSTPIFFDNQGTDKTSGYNINASAKFSK